jgi:MSHA pilin protein MshA
MSSHARAPHPTPKNLGFSLVEVVVMVTLLGMGAAFAVPRFTSLANRTRASEVLALSKELRSSVEAAHSQFVVGGSHLSAVSLKGKAVALRNGYPEASANGIGNAIISWDGFTTKTGPSIVVFFKTGAPSDALCSVTYRAAPEPAIAAAITDINISGC